MASRRGERRRWFAIRGIVEYAACSRQWYSCPALCCSQSNIRYAAAAPFLFRATHTTFSWTTGSNSALKTSASELIAGIFVMQRKSTIEIDKSPASVQHLPRSTKLHGLEGIAFSSSGNIIAVAASHANAILLFRQKANGQFDSAPYGSISGPESRLKYPHDVSFAPSANGELLAVAQRGGSIAIFHQGEGSESYGSAPIFEIRGPKTGLQFSDGVAFVPPNNDHLAACNLETGTITFYRMTSAAPVRFSLEPVSKLQHKSLANPDGLAFSRCGRWLAVASHGNHSVSIFKRRNRMFPGRKLMYGPKPVTIIKDPRLRYPHSVAFMPETNHLVVTNAGANHFSVYAPTKGVLGVGWSQSPLVEETVGPDDAFSDVNSRNEMEGGPKGIAIHQTRLAICGPVHGIKIYSFRELLSVA